MKSKELFEEKLNAYSHGIGFVFAILGGFILLNNSKANLKLGLLVYTLSLGLLFLASTLYHNSKNPIIKQKLRVLDHISIYYLIAGTYTPVCLSLLKDSSGILLLALVWGIAVFGTLLKLFFTGKFEVFSLLLYAVMGWLIIIDLEALILQASNSGLFYLALGGSFYTIGIVFYAIKKIPYNHFIWHLFVLGGALSHWVFIYLELILPL